MDKALVYGTRDSGFSIPSGVASAISFYQFCFVFGNALFQPFNFTAENFQFHYNIDIPFPIPSSTFRFTAAELIAEGKKIFIKVDVTQSPGNLSFFFGEGKRGLLLLNNQVTILSNKLLDTNWNYIAPNSRTVGP